jgi:hypothetical protein
MPATPMTTKLTNDTLKAVLSIDSEAGLARQLDRVYNVYAHLDHALYDHLVFLELGPCQHCILNTTSIVGRSHESLTFTCIDSDQAFGCTDVRRFSDGTGKDDSP